MSNTPKPRRSDFPTVYYVTFVSDCLPDDGSHIAEDAFLLGPYTWEEATAAVTKEYPNAVVDDDWSDIEDRGFRRSDADGWLWAGHISREQPGYEDALQEWRIEQFIPPTDDELREHSVGESDEDECGICGAALADGSGIECECCGLVLCSGSCERKHGCT